MEMHVWTLEGHQNRILLLSFFNLASCDSSCPNGISISFLDEYRMRTIAWVKLAKSSKGSVLKTKSVNAAIISIRIFRCHCTFSKEIHFSSRDVNEIPLCPESCRSLWMGKEYQKYTLVRAHLKTDTDARQIALSLVKITTAIPVHVAAGIKPKKSFLIRTISHPSVAQRISQPLLFELSISFLLSSFYVDKQAQLKQKRFLRSLITSVPRIRAATIFCPQLIVLVTQASSYVGSTMQSATAQRSMCMRRVPAVAAIRRYLSRSPDRTSARYRHVFLVSRETWISARYITRNDKAQ